MTRDRQGFRNREIKKYAFIRNHMRTLFWYFLITLFSTTHVDSEDIKLSGASPISPKYYGNLHTDAFQQLSEKISKRRPRSRASIKSDFATILSSYCDHTKDEECLSHVQDAVDIGFSATKDGPLRVHYPDYLQTSDAIDSIVTIIESLTEDNIDETISNLYKVEREIDEMNGVFWGHKKIAQAAASIAIESTKFWYKVYLEPTNPLYINETTSCAAPFHAIALIPTILTDVAGVFFWTVPLATALGALAIPLTALILPFVWSFLLILSVTDFNFDNAGLIFLILVFYPFLLIPAVLSAVPAAFSAGVYSFFYFPPAWFLEDISGCVNDDAFFDTNFDDPYDD